jgi:uncharacterized membrane protein
VGWLLVATAVILLPLTAAAGYLALFDQDCDRRKDARKVLKVLLWSLGTTTAVTGGLRILDALHALGLLR